MGAIEEGGGGGGGRAMCHCQHTMGYNLTLFFYIHILSSTGDALWC